MPVINQRLFRLVTLYAILCVWACLSESDDSDSSAAPEIPSEDEKHFQYGGVTGAPDLTRVHQHRIYARSLNPDDENEVMPSPFTYMVSPLTGMGQVIVNPSACFINFTEEAERLELQRESSTEQSTSLIDWNQTPAHLSVTTILPSALPLSLGIGQQAQQPLRTTSPVKPTIVGSYYPDWIVNNLPPDQVQYKKFDLLYFAFAIPTESASVEFTQSDSLATLDQLIKFAHGNGTKVVLSIGGWGGSKYFSSVVKNQTAREMFVNNIYDLVNSHDLDGIDIDWEYPGQAQVQDNIVSPQDTQALLSFFQMLRAKLGPHRIIAAAVTDYTFVGPDGKRLKSVAGFGEVLDYVLIMNYDVTGSSSHPGPNAPFSNGCHDSSQPGANMISAIQTWTDAGFPKTKLLMGLPAYGYINWSSASSLVHKKRNSLQRGATRFEQYLANAQNRFKRRQSLCHPEGGNCTQTQALVTSASQNSTLVQNNTNSSLSIASSLSRALTRVTSSSGDLSTYPGPQIQFKDLFQWGVLGRDLSTSNGNLTGINGYTMAWDDCSKTPYAYNKDRNTVVTYDDANSTGIKAAYALGSGIGGVGFWEISGDYQSMLTDSARKSLGKTE